MTIIKLRYSTVDKNYDRSNNDGNYIIFSLGS